MSIFWLNYIFFIEILIFKFKKNNLEFKHQFLHQISFLNLNWKTQNWNVNFQIHLTKFKIEMPFFWLN
jgi:hypothetical protein